MQQLPPGFQLDTQAQPSQFPGVIRGPAKAVDANEQTRIAMEMERVRLAQAQEERDRLKFEQEQGEVAKEASLGRDAQYAGIRELTGVIGEIDKVVRDAKDNRGWGETGATGAILGQIPGTAGYDLRQDVMTIDASKVLDAMAELKRLSPTGSTGFGALSAPELDLLKSSVANINPNQSQDAFLENISTARQAYLDKLRLFDPAVVREYLGVPADTPADQWTEAESLITWGNVVYDEKGNPLGPDGGQGFDKEGNPLGLFGSGPTQGGGEGTPQPSTGGFLGYSGETWKQGLSMGLGDIVEGIGDTLGIVANPIGQAIYNATGYGNQAYDSGAVLRGAAGLPQSPDNATSRAIQFGTAALTGGLAARGAAAAFQPGVTRNALSTVGRTPMRDTAAGVGAGFGSSVGEEMGGTAGQVVGILGGGLVGAGAGNALARVAGGGTQSALASAATRQGVDLLPAETGGPIARAVTTGTKASPISVAPVMKEANRQQGQMSNAARRIAESQGEIVDNQQAGEAIQRAAKNFSASTAATGSRLYDRAYELSKGVKIKPNRTMAALDEQIARMEENPAAGALLGQLKDIRSKIEGGISIRGLRDARTSLSTGVFDGQLRSGQDKAILKQIFGEIATDIDAGLRSVGRDDAANTFRNADRFWSSRVEVIDQVLQPIIGKEGMKSGEDVLQAIETMARGKTGGNMRLGRLMAGLSDVEQGNVRAVIIDRLGKANPGQQTAEGAAFSASTFLTNWNKMTPQAKATLFANGKLRADLNDLATLAEGKKLGASMANTSNTGVAVNTISTLGLGAGAVTSLPLTLLGAGSIYLTGRLMASPGFARLLARTAKMPPEAANRTFREQLGVIAAREGAAGRDAGRLLQAVNDNVAAPLAAEPTEPGSQ